MQTTHSIKNDLLIVGVTLLAAAGWMFSKFSLEGMPPLYFLCIRFSLASLVLAAFSLHQLRSLSRRQWRDAAALGALFSLAMIIWIKGLQHTHHVGEGAFIGSMSVVIIPLFARFLFRDELPFSTWLALPVAVSGLALLSLDQGLQPEPGQLLFLTSATIFALHFNFLTRMANQIPVTALTAIQLGLIGIFSGIGAQATESFPTVVSPAIWGWILASALLATSIRFLLQAYAQARTSTAHAAIIMVLEPVWTALMAVLWLNETMTGLQLTGCTLIFMALLVNRWRTLRNLIRKK